MTTPSHPQPLPEENTITIYEDWDEIDGEIWYKWRLPGDVSWHMKLTPYKQKPVIRFKQISKVEFDEFYATDGKDNRGGKL